MSKTYFRRTWAIEAAARVEAEMELEQWRLMPGMACPEGDHDAHGFDNPCDEWDPICETCGDFGCGVPSLCA